MADTLTRRLDGALLQYTYPELGTVRVRFDDGRVGFEWLAGAFAGEAADGFAYRARQVGPEQYFVNWHEPETRGFVTLHVDLAAGTVCSSVLAAYGSDEEQVLFHDATIERAELPA